MIGSVIREYEIISRIGEGGMGEVYLARHQYLGDRVAIKALAPELIRYPEFQDRFIKEARSQFALKHKNIVQLLNFMNMAGNLYLVMEYVDGENLETLLRKNRLFPADVALPIIKDALNALNFAHSKGFIHRDVKPSNILVAMDGTAKIMDFGIALKSGAGGRITKTGVTLGTPHYMSPEQILHPKEIDHRNDVYSIGIILYEMLSGRLPFDAPTDHLVKEKHVNEIPPDIRSVNGKISPGLAEIVMKALKKKPDDRFAGCGQFLRHIENYEQKKTPPRCINIEKPVKKQHDTFARIETHDYYPISLAILLGMTAIISFNAGSFKINLCPFQTLFTFLLGYRYGKKAGIVSGLIVFFPELVLYHADAMFVEAVVTKNVFSGCIRVNDINIRTLGIISFIMHVSMGYVSALLKERLENLENRLRFIRVDGKTGSPLVCLLSIPIILFCFDCKLDELTMDASAIVPFAFLAVSFYHGAGKAFLIILCCSPIFAVNYSLNDNFGFGYSVEAGEPLFHILTAILIAGYLNRVPSETWTAKSGILFTAFLVVCYFFSIRYGCLEKFISETFSFYVPSNLFLSGSLAMVVLSGYVFGSFKGFWFGILLGLCNIVSTVIFEDIYLFNNEPFFSISAPIIGYLAGTGTVRRGNFLIRGFRLLLWFHPLLWIIYLINEERNWEMYLHPFIYFVFCCIFLYAVYSFFCLLKVIGIDWEQKPQANERG